MVDDGDSGGRGGYRTNIYAGFLGLHDALDVGLSNLEVPLVARHDGGERDAHLSVAATAWHDDAENPRKMVGMEKVPTKTWKKIVSLNKKCGSVGRPQHKMTQNRTLQKTYAMQHLF